MSFWDKLEKIFKPEDNAYPNPIKPVEVELICDECGNYALDSHTVDDMFICMPCEQAIERRTRFKEEEDEWNKA